MWQAAFSELSMRICKLVLHHKSMTWTFITVIPGLQTRKLKSTEESNLPEVT